MLVLTRKVGEHIYIGDKIRVTVVLVNGNKVRIGISAPASVSIHREEVLRRIREAFLPAVAAEVVAAPAGLPSEDVRTPGAGEPSPPAMPR